MNETAGEMPHVQGLIQVPSLYPLWTPLFLFWDQQIQLKESWRLTNRYMNLLMSMKQFKDFNLWSNAFNLNSGFFTHSGIISVGCDPLDQSK